MRSGTGRRWVAAFLGAGLVAASGCGDDGDEVGQATATAEDGNGPSVVVTTSILGDIVGEVFAGEADVQTLMPPGADPHRFSLSLSEASDVMEADLLVVNGLDLEEGLADVIGQAEDEGVEVFTFADHVSLLAAEDGHDHDGAGEGDGDGRGDEDHGGDGAHAEDAHDDGDHDHEGSGDAAGHDEHDHGPEDPHIWTDPTRMVPAVGDLVDAAVRLDGVDPETVEDNGAAYVDDLHDLDAEIDGLLADVPDDRRVLVTNHEVFGYFADRYDFEIVGTVIPSTSSLAEASQQELEDLVDVVDDHDVPAVFTEASEDASRAETLAAEAGDVEIVELHGESLGGEGSDAATYLAMMRTNAARVAEALG